MENNSSGFDPKQILKSASSNVISSFCLNESYDFGDSEQMKILEWTEFCFKNFRSQFIVSGLAHFYPDFIIRHGISRKILTTFQVSTFDPSKTSLTMKQNDASKAGFLTLSRA